MNCKICGCADSKIIYIGSIRMGRFGNISNESYQIRQCSFCTVIVLPTLIENTTDYYQSDAYRQEVDDGTDVSHYYRLHDVEQIRNLSITGTGAFRGQVVADIGCGGGSFLDLIRGFAKLAIAVEPSTTYRSVLTVKGYDTYSSVLEALCKYKATVDLATSFSVLEHVEDPLDFLKQISNLLSPKGRLVISTPNADDVLLRALPDDYPHFFYRKAHIWYFNRTALLKLLELAGYTHIRVVPFQRFGLANFLSWIKDKAPKGNLSSEFVTDVMDKVWKAELERTFNCDYLFAEAERM